MLTTPHLAKIPAAELLSAYRYHCAAKMARTMEGEGFTADELKNYVERCRAFEDAFFLAASDSAHQHLAAWGVDARAEALAVWREMMRD
ncbi:hypothetical protein [Deinococcus fonticola]|uniref:hypothetical protein n=1 Tax=Deinococcus fonticola TaxID=2528713 RepID=UPI0010752ACB|nr:hypothetical protein [Deinococcus fonticola]